MECRAGGGVQEARESQGGQQELGVPKHPPGIFLAKLWTPDPNLPVMIAAAAVVVVCSGSSYDRSCRGSTRNLVAVIMIVGEARVG